MAEDIIPAHLLHAAVEDADQETVRNLLQNETIDVNAPDPRHGANHGFTPLVIAISKKNVAMARLLLADARVDPTVVDTNDDNALHHAVWNDLEPIVVDLLRDPRLDLNAEGHYG